MHIQQRKGSHYWALTKILIPNTTTGTAGRCEFGGLDVSPGVKISGSEAAAEAARRAWTRQRRHMDESVVSSGDTNTGHMSTSINPLPSVSFALALPAAPRISTRSCTGNAARSVHMEKNSNIIPAQRQESCTTKCQCRIFFYPSKPSHVKIHLRC